MQRERDKNMSRDMCADVKMEEGYMRMSVEYNNEDSKKIYTDKELEAMSSQELDNLLEI